MAVTSSLPEYFCWSKFGAEAGQWTERILIRKERERQANGGVFLWGVGNAVGPSLRRLLQLTRSPQVIFSPIRSSPRESDVAPPGVVAWRHSTTLSGQPWPLPEHSLVTSGYNPQPRARRFALVCKSDEPLWPAVQGARRVALRNLTNLLTGRPVGSSQVTAVVRHRTEAYGTETLYEVSMQAELVDPYFVELRTPVTLPSDLDLNAADQSWVAEALELVRRIVPATNGGWLDFQSTRR